MSVALLKTQPLGLSPDLGPYRRADYEALPDEPRCELIYGRLHLSPSPTPLHQYVALGLWQRIREIADRTGGRVLAAPMDVYLADHSVVQPDVLYFVPERRHRIGKTIEGAPDLLIEVLSPSTARRDRGDKSRLYAEAGVREYWIVEPRDQQIEFFVHRDGHFTLEYPDGDVYTSPLLPGVRLDLQTLWHEVEEQLA